MTEGRILCQNSAGFACAPFASTMSGASDAVPRTSGTIGSRSSKGAALFLRFICFTSRLVFEAGRFLFLLQLLQTLAELLKAACDSAKIVLLVRNHAARAVLDAARRVPEIAAAVTSQRVQRTVAEQTVKVLRICACMTRKIFTFLIAEKSIVFPFPIWFFHLLSPRYIKKSSHGTAELVIFETYFRGFAILLRGRQ